MSSANKPRTGFFHTLVVFGAGTALAGCGAKVVGNEGAEKSGPHGGQSAEDGGVSMEGTGGRPSGTSGAPAASGHAGTGGDPTATGGAGAGGGTGMDLGTTAQWNCDGMWSGCTDISTDESVQTYFLLASPCPVDTTKPRSEADCAAGEQLECARAVYRDSTLVVDCVCLPSTESETCEGTASTLVTCSFRPTGSPWFADGICVGRTKLCGCMTGILR